MKKTRDETYINRLVDCILWNEILTGQPLESIHRLSENMGSDFPADLLEGMYYLLVTGFERRAYRTIGVDAMQYDAQTYAYWLEKKDSIFAMGYEALYAMNIFDDTKRLIYVLKPVKKDAVPVKQAAQEIAQGLQTHYEQHFLHGSSLHNFSVLSEPLCSVEELAPTFKKLCKLHQCAFFQQEPYFVTEKEIEQIKAHCEYRDLLQMTHELPSLIVDGEKEDMLALLEEMFLNRIRHSYNVNLCYDTTNAVIARMLEIDDAYQLGLSEELSGFVPQKCATFDVLYGRLLELIERCMQGVCDSKRRYCAITRAAVTYIHHNYAKAFTLAELADSVNAAPSYVSRMFNRDVGESIPTYLTRIRMQNATKMLMETEKSIREIAQEVGFLGASYFGRIFKEEMGMTPKAYRELHGITEAKDD